MARLSFGVLAVLVAQVFSDPECTPMGQIYTDGKDLCETMFGTAFKYEEDLEHAYTMWFFDRINPNNAVSDKRVAAEKNTTHHSYDKCHLDYLHKDGQPTPEAENLNECHPWQHESCCSYENVKDAKTINEAYGEGYHWDRCGPLSPACERFFVQEACFYECDPNIGMYRKYPDGVYNASNPDHNTWQVEGMPIRADYCNAWYRACKHDLFCGVNGGDYFACAKVPDLPKEPETPSTSPTTGSASVVINMYNSGSGGCPNN